jgi:hypothetical protein
MIFLSKPTNLGSGIPMKNHLFCFLALISVVVVAVPTYAEPAASVTASPVPDMAERLRLSRELHDVRRIRGKIDDMIEAISKTMPVQDREDFMTYMSESMNYDKLEDASVKYAAEIYSAPELQAMIAYFGSPDGQSAEAKGDDYAAKFSKDIEKEIDAAMMAVKLKERPQSTPANPVKN